MRGGARALFAAALLFILGIANIIYGIGALNDAHVLVNDQRFVLTNLNTAGWVTLILGVIQLSGGLSLISGNTYGRVIGVLGAGLGAIGSLMSMGSGYPWWSLCLFFLSIYVLHGILIYDPERLEPEGPEPGRHMNLDALWHDLECGDYGEDLPLWRALAAEAGGTVLDIGAGTGRVTLDLAGAGVPVVALDAERSLLEALAHRANGGPVETVLADARAFDLGDRRFSLVLVPMQTLQLFGGRRGRAAFLRRAIEHLEPGGVVAAALADATGCFDEEHSVPPPPAVCEVADVLYASRLLAVTEEGGCAAIHRRREIVGPGERYEAQDVSCGSTGSPRRRSRWRPARSASCARPIGSSRRPRSTSARRWSCSGRRMAPDRS